MWNLWHINFEGYFHLGNRKKILAPKYFVPSNIINYAWNLNSSNTNSMCPYLPSTFLLFLDSTWFFALWLSCCSWLGHQNKKTILSWCICKRRFAHPQAAQVWNQMAAARWTHREHFYQCSLWKDLGEKGDLYFLFFFFLIKKEELKKKLFCRSSFIRRTMPKFFPVMEAYKRPRAIKGVFLHQNLPKDLAGSQPITNLDN